MIKPSDIVDGGVQDRPLVSHHVRGHLHLLGDFVQKVIHPLSLIVVSNNAGSRSVAPVKGMEEFVAVIQERYGFFNAWGLILAHGNAHTLAYSLAISVNPQSNEVRRRRQAHEEQWVAEEGSRARAAHRLHGREMLVPTRPVFRMVSIFDSPVFESASELPPARTAPHDVGVEGPVVEAGVLNHPTGGDDDLIPRVFVPHLPVGSLAEANLQLLLLLASEVVELVVVEEPTKPEVRAGVEEDVVRRRGDAVGLRDVRSERRRAHEIVGGGPRPVHARPVARVRAWGHARGYVPCHVEAVEILAHPRERRGHGLRVR
mmetsp:Transcript_25272/g.47157  ORF Transcript_25272/g.47157 Transcript_25272/m.47157 type:complete len:316 (+) Transcript_25272:233-1180(+)